MSEDFYGVTSHCFVPATSFLPTGKLGCSMVARIEEFEPCIKAARNGDVISSSVVAATPSPTLPPTPAPTPVPTAASPPIPIPTDAHDAYCTAIMGYYDRCNRLDNDAPETATMCDGANYVPLPKPVFIDLVTCYANPFNADGNSVTFFGRTPDQQKVLEFHMIFHDSASKDLKPRNCEKDGACD
jgi:hypothetical protein